ncbi:carbamoyltransferase HypF [Barnesiella intestinihominis]|uniref:carbamoyltransferase HypF n=1 Tax=Barnesiella intestinihominis TaxID=487174 RepID=UPI003AB7A793
MNQYHIHVRGLVQGVGFRPYVYRLATEMGLRGYVDNSNDGVFIVLQSTCIQKEKFLKALIKSAPEVASIEHIETVQRRVSKKYESFDIAPSRSSGDEITRISPDIAICSDCLKDRKHQLHRMGYPFINCTHCGPRFSIIEKLPYDRAVTTMSSFGMCDTCREEYADVNDRRFHAQPIACNECGPHYTLRDSEGNEDTVYIRIVSRISDVLSNGGVVALKSLGGYNLICDADNEQAVARIRELKGRYAKPLAVMYRDEREVMVDLNLSDEERKALNSWRRPIVLAEEKVHNAPWLNEGYRSLGVLLPYMAIHYDLFTEAPELRRIVVTSGNMGGRPIVIADEEAHDLFDSKVDSVVSYNRDIYNRVDDSVVQEYDGVCRPIRRSRGYTPEPLRNVQATEGILAVGAEQVSCFAIGKKEDILLGQYIGELSCRENLSFFEESISHFSRMFRFEPRCVVCDLHPDYFATAWGERCAAERHIPVYRVQHHHAHAVAVMAEYALTGDVLALCLDGTGYGDDCTIWGGELIRCSRTEYRRLSHHLYLPMPGGDIAAREPWRMAVSLLYSLYGENMSLPDNFVKRVGEDRIKLVSRMIARRINTPLSSGAGRLFDAVASLLGIADFNRYRSEAPQKLEQVANRSILKIYSFDKDNPLDFSWLVKAVLNDLQKGVPLSEIASAFHRTYAAMWCVELAKQAVRQKLSRVVLCGGVFQNKLLVDILMPMLRQLGLQPYLPASVPCNDAGIAVGQMAVTAAWIEQSMNHNDKRHARVVVGL